MWQLEKTTAPIRTGSCAVSYFEKKWTADQRPVHWQSACCNFASFNAENKEIKEWDALRYFRNYKQYVLWYAWYSHTFCFILLFSIHQIIFFFLSATGKWLILNDKTEMFSLWPHRTWVKLWRVKKTKNKWNTSKQRQCISLSVLTVATWAFPWQINDNYSKIQSISPIL